nr:response regulator [Lachnospiraceae bacterium]
ILRSMDCNLIQGFYFSKPMPEEDFVEMLKASKRTVERQSADLVQAFGEVKEDRPTVMFVTSIAINSFLLKSTFEGAYNVLATYFGYAALDYFENENKVDVVITELPLEDTTGLEFIKTMKENPDTSRIPILYMCQADESMLIQAHDAGADDVIFKPFSDQDIRLAVDNLVSRFSEPGATEDINLKNIKMMHDVASTDLITGLYNREELKSKTDRRIKFAEGEGFYFVVIEVDNLYENINGRDYRESDKIIKDVSGRISKHFADVDVLGRVGGKCFAGYFRNNITEEELQRRLRKMRRSLHFVVGDVEIKCSLGVSHYPDDGCCFDEIYRAAEKNIKHVRDYKKSKP